MHELVQRWEEQQFSFSNMMLGIYVKAEILQVEKNKKFE